MSFATKTTRFLVSPNLQQWMYKVSGFNQYGLMRDDLLSEFRPEVREALRRLPKDLRDERTFRIIRAMQLDLQRIVLPKEQWTKLEEDVLYLTPYVREVVAEMEEKAKWDADH